jgi:hypothetical protein
MSEDPDPPRQTGDSTFRSHRARDAALVLPVAGLLLIAPPVVNFFVADITVFGAPLIGVYLFTVWGGLILCAQRLSHRLREGDTP